MILWKFKSETESQPRFPEIGIRGWQNLLVIEGGFIGLKKQIFYPAEPGGFPRDINYIGLQFTKRWHWGAEHGWYHSSLSTLAFGFCYWVFSRSKDCSKCWPED